MPINASKTALPFSRTLRLLSGIFLLAPLQLLGAEQAAPVTPPPVPHTEQTIPQTPIPSKFDVMEAPRNYVSDKIANFASSIDRFFGGDRHYQESNQSVVRLYLTRTTGYGGNDKFDFSARANLRLPITEGRLRLLVETDPENNITAEPTPGSTVPNNQNVAPKNVALAVRYATAEESVWHFSTDWGVKFPLPPNPFVRSRGSYSVPLRNEWRLKATETIFWFNTLGVGETTQLDLERIISTPLLFRASSTATWLKDKKNFDLRQDFTFFHTVNDRTAVRYQASAIGVSNPAYTVTDYVMLIHYRYRLHREWLFFELTPQLHFPKIENYQFSPAFSMRLEVLFNQSR